MSSRRVKYEAKGNKATVIAALEGELARVQQQLGAERARNEEARLRVALLAALTATGHALRAYLGEGGGGGGGGGGGLGDATGSLGGAEGSLALDAACDALGRALHGACGDEGGGGSGADDAGSEGAARSGGSGSGSGAAGGSGSGSGSGSGAAGAARAGGAGASGSGGADGSGSDARLSGGVRSQSTGDMSQSDAPTFYGGVGTSASAFVERGLALAEDDPIERDEFVAWWRERVMGLALLAHMQDGDEAALEELTAALHEMSARSLGMVLAGRLWFYARFNFDFSRGEAAEAPASMAQKVSRGLRLTPQQSAVFGMITAWWDSTEAMLKAQQAALAEEAVAAPGDVELQARVSADLRGVLFWYQVGLIPFYVLMVTSILTPRQLSQFYIQAWPWMPVLTPILRELQHAVASAAPPAPAPAPARGGGRRRGGGA